jgi:DNA-binding Lrp family transcriptional regulator
MVYNLDLKDRKLIYELDINSRQSFNELGKKIGLSKNSVIYRINNLQKEKIINKFISVIDIGKLGGISFRFYIKLENTTPTKEQEIIDFLKKEEMVTWVVSMDGDYDLGFIIITKNIKEVNKFWQIFYKKYINYIDNTLFGIMTKVSYYSRAYLNLKQNNYESIFVDEPEKVELDNISIEILKKLATDSRMKIIDIAGILKITPKTVINKIKGLENKKIITGYRTFFDVDKLGYLYFKIHFKLHNINKEKEEKLRIYVKNHPNIIFKDEALGGYDLEIELQVENMQELRKIIERIKLEFSEIIKEHKVLQLYKEHKHLFFPNKF